MQTRDEFVDNQIAALNQILNILYVLLALSVIVSLFGIVNTLVLTVFERTRELGMLRAVGMTRRQVRRMIRHESVITALIGGALGIMLGVVLGALLVARVEFIDFALPIEPAHRLRDRRRSSSGSWPRSSRRGARRGWTRSRRSSTSSLGRGDGGERRAAAEAAASGVSARLGICSRRSPALRRRGGSRCATSGRGTGSRTSRRRSPDVRADLVRRLAAAGLPRIEAVSFVSDERVPQMAGAEEVVAAVGRSTPSCPGSS